MVAPVEARQNLDRLTTIGALGDYGWYEAIDYTPTRLPPDEKCAVVRSFMAHHQGMSLLAFAHVLLDRPMQRRFERDPQFQATLLLLQAKSSVCRPPEQKPMTPTLAVAPGMPRR